MYVWFKLTRRVNTNYRFNYSRRVYNSCSLYNNRNSNNNSYYYCSSPTSCGSYSNLGRTICRTTQWQQKCTISSSCPTSCNTGEYNFKMVTWLNIWQCITWVFRVFLIPFGEYCTVHLLICFYLLPSHSVMSSTEKDMASFSSALISSSLRKILHFCKSEWPDFNH